MQQHNELSSVEKNLQNVSPYLRSTRAYRDWLKNMSSLLIFANFEGVRYFDNLSHIRSSDILPWKYQESKVASLPTDYIYNLKFYLISFI